MNSRKQDQEMQSPTKQSSAIKKGAQQKTPESIAVQQHTQQKFTSASKASNMDPIINQTYTIDTTTTSQSQKQTKSNDDSPLYYLKVIQSSKLDWNYLYHRRFGVVGSYILEKLLTRECSYSRDLLNLLHGWLTLTVFEFENRYETALPKDSTEKIPYLSEARLIDMIQPKLYFPEYIAAPQSDSKSISSFFNRPYIQVRLIICIQPTSCSLDQIADVFFGEESSLKEKGIQRYCLSEKIPGIIGSRIKIVLQTFYYELGYCQFLPVPSIKIGTMHNAGMQFAVIDCCSSVAELIASTFVADIANYFPDLLSMDIDHNQMKLVVLQLRTGQEYKNIATSKDETIPATCWGHNEQGEQMDIPSEEKEFIDQEQNPAEKLMIALQKESATHGMRAPDFDLFEKLELSILENLGQVSGGPFTYAIPPNAELHLQKPTELQQ